MGQNIKDFNNWHKLNEQSYFGWASALAGNVAAAFTGTPSSTETKPAETPAKTDDSAKEKPVAPITKSNIKDKEYTAKIQDISKKLGGETPPSTVDADSKIFIALDLSKPTNVKLYGQICQEWIDIRKPMVAKVANPITGSDFAEAAAEVYKKTGAYVPPQLVLAQATLEGGFAKESNKPIATKNLFNVGNTDDGSTKSFDDKGNSLPGGDPKATWKGGIIAYFNLLADRYLVPGKRTADDLILGEFVNTAGNRYASSRKYEQGLLKLIDEINTTVIA